MSYDSLAGGASFLAKNQLPALLTYVEGSPKWLYNDGSGNATIGVGLNLNSSANNMALVLNQMIFTGTATVNGISLNGLNVLQAASLIFGLSATTVVNTFEDIVTAASPLSGVADGLKSTILQQDPSTQALQISLRNV